MEYRLPVPPPLNSVYRSTFQGGKPRTYKSKEAKLYQEEIAWRLKQEKPLEGQVKLVLFFAFSRDRDIDSGLKVLLDSLSGYLYLDDKQIVELVVTKSVIPRSGTIKPYVLITCTASSSIDKDVPF